MEVTSSQLVLQEGALRDLRQHRSGAQGAPVAAREVSGTSLAGGVVLPQLL